MDYKTLGKNPISAESTVGVDVRYDDHFEILQAEIDKLSNPTARGSFQWETVAKTASLILQNESKDLLVASYMGVALVNLQGATGLDAATQIYKDLLSEYWESMFPPAKRLRGRVAAVEWWIARTTKALESGEPGTVSEAVSVEVKERLNEIEKLLDTYLGDKILLRPLIRSAESFLSRGIVPDPREETVAEPEVPAVSAASSPPQRIAANASPSVDLSTPSVALDSANQVHKQLRPVFQKIAQGAKLLQDTAVSDPQGYQWMRFAAYSGLKMMPHSGGDGKTTIAAPPPQLVSRLKSLHQTGSWSDLLHASENALMNIQYVFWLDLNRYSALALNHMNGCDDALRAVEIGVKDLLTRLPGIDTLRFSNDQPFADEETVEWIQGLQEHEGNPNQDAASVSLSDPLDKSLEEAIAEARQIAEDSKRIGGALRILEKAICGCESEKDVLELRLIMLELLAKGRQPEPAAALAELILDDVERFHLREWDVPLAVKCHMLVYDVFKKASGKDYKDQQRTVYQRILSMSAAAALNL